MILTREYHDDKHRSRQSMELRGEKLEALHVEYLGNYTVLVMMESRLGKCHIG